MVCAILVLPCFDPVQFSAVDSMHNLFLGTGKHMFSVCVEEGVLTKQNLTQLDTNAKLFCAPFLTLFKHMKIYALQ